MNANAGNVIDLGADQLLDVPAAARLLCVGVNTLRGWIAQGAIPVWQPGGPGGQIFISRAALAQCALKDSTRQRAALKPRPTLNACATNGEIPMPEVKLKLGRPKLVK